LFDNLKSACGATAHIIKIGDTMATQNHKAWYAAVFANWSNTAIPLGPQPTNEQLGIVHALGMRCGKQALANAMALREKGVSGAEIKAMSALFDGNATPQLNKLRDNIQVSGVFERLPVAGRYVVKLTKLGHEKVKQGADRALTGTPSLKAAEGVKLPPKGTKAEATGKAAKPAGKGKAPKAATPKAAKAAPTSKPAKGPAEPAKTEAKAVLTNDGPVTIS